MNEFDDLNLDVLVQTGVGAAAPMSVGVSSTPGVPEGTTSVSAGGTGVKVPGDPRIPSYNSRKKRNKKERKK